MADYRSYSYNSAGPSQKQPPESMQRTLTRNSQHTHQSVADSTLSWVQNQGQPAGRPTIAPRSSDTPTVVQRLRPLPNPHPQAAIQRPLHVVNVPNTPHRDHEEHKDMNTDGRRMEFGSQAKGFEKGNSAETASAPSTDFVRPQKKKRFVGGFVKRIRRLPTTMFGYGAGEGSDRKKLQRSGTLLTDATSTSATGTTGNTFPAHGSNLPTSSAIPGRSGLRVQYTPGLIVSQPTEPPIPESPLPNVVRLSSNRVPVPLVNFANEENGRLAAGSHMLSRKPTNELSYGSQAERATVMLYHDPNSQYYEDDRVAPRPVPPVVSRQPSGPALSYVADPLPLQPVRPSSFHSSHTDVLPPLEIPKRVPTPGPNGPRVSYASQIPPRHTTPQSLIPGAHPSPSPPAQLELQTVPPSFLQQTNLPPQPTEDVQSPVTAHPKHTADYRKMTTSLSPTSHNTFATGSSYYDPSFSQLSPVERFFTTLYRMPWISHNRVTVDYLPGAGAGVRRKRKMKPIASWYRSVMSRSSRNSESIDVLSSGTANSPRSNLRASLAMILGSPSSKRSSDRHRSKRHRSHDESKDSHPRHHHSSRHQHRRHHHSHTDTGRRRTTTSMDTADKDGYARTESSPLIPPMYPYQYPPYPYPSFPSFPVPAPVPTIGDEQLSKIQSKETHKRASPRGPRAVPQPSSMFYTPAPGYGSYQPMIAPPPQVYFIQSPISPTYGGVASVPPALVPGGVHESGHAHGVQYGGGKVQQQDLQPAVVPSGLGSGRSVPGAFST